MEGFLLSLFKTGGPVALVGVLIFWLVRIERTLNKIQDSFVCKDEFAVLQQKVDTLSNETQRKEDFYRDISGWREDIRYLAEKLDKVILEVMKR
jgi:hypothetical protein